MEKLMDNGALDVFWTPIYMKKGRPAYMLSVITKEELKEKLTNIIFEETKTLGIREKIMERKTLDRDFVRLKTIYGEVVFKKIKNNKEELTVEYEEAKKIAKENDISLIEVYDYFKSVIKDYEGDGHE